MLDALVYDAMLAAFIVHELDAMRRHEWRLLPLTAFLPERVGERVFFWAHLPLLVAILWFDGSAAFRIGLAAFAVAHLGLHVVYRRHPANEFVGLESWAVIVATAVLGAGYVALAWPMWPGGGA